MKNITLECVISIMEVFQKNWLQKKTLPLNGNLNISFDHVEILSRNSLKKNSYKKN